MMNQRKKLLNQKMKTLINNLIIFLVILSRLTLNKKKFQDAKAII